MNHLKDIITRESTPEEHDFYINLMSQGRKTDKPKVGIFWYNPQRNELFGVVALELDDPGVNTCKKGLTCKILHQDFWKQEYRRLRFKEHKENTFPFIGRYEDKPRGRVFMKDGRFQITTGHWVNDDDNYRVYELVENAFGLTDQDVDEVIDRHWDLGCGWDRQC